MKLTGYYTKAGEQIAAGLLAGKTLSITKITAGAGSTSTAAAALDQEKQDLGPCTPEVAGATAVIRCTLTSTQAEEPYFLRELGVYALNESGQQVLYLIFRLDEQVSIHPSFRLILRFNLEQTLSDGAGVKVTAPLTGVATQADLQSKADLVGGQVPYAQTPHLTGNKTVYVDAALGNDANSGTQENPFKTIQAAVNALPKDLGAYTATINVAAGTYDEDVEFKGFSAGNVYQGIRLVGAESADTSRKVRTLRINGCSAFVKIQGFSFFGSAIGIAVEVCNARATLSSLIIKKSEADAATVGIAIGGHAPAQATISNCTVDGYQFGIRVDYSSLAGIIKTTVKNCTCGVEGGSSMTGTAGIAMLHQPTYEGNTSNTVAYYGGQIFGGV